MKDISQFVQYFARLYRQRCSSWNPEQGQCSNPNGCICQKFAEVNSHIRALVPESYRDKSIYDFNGCLPSGEEVVAAEDVERIQNQLWSYMYGDTPFKEGMSRRELNSISILDERFRRGNCLLIHGDQRGFKKGNNLAAPVQHKTQTGKSLLASVVMIDACWRRCFNKKALSYDWISFLTMRPLLKTRRGEHPTIEAARESDWLIIDDINLIGSDAYDTAANWTREQFDGFLMNRISEGLPTILVANFDIDKHGLSSNMGDAFNKIAHSPSSTVIKVEGVSKGARA